jgi:hypothetical protein
MSDHQASAIMDFIEFFIENEGSAFTINAISNKLEEIIKDTGVLDYAKENLQKILNKMGKDGIIDIVEQNGEFHYLIKKEEEPSDVKEEQKANGKQIEMGELLEIAEKKEKKPKLESIKEWIDDVREGISKWLLLSGLFIGLLTCVGLIVLENISEIVISLSVLLVLASIGVEIYASSKLSKKNLKYYPPKFGILALVFNVTGLILMLILNAGTFIGIWQNLWSLVAAPFLVASILCCIAGIDMDKDERPYAAMIGLFLGVILLLVSIFSLFAFLLRFLGVFIH